MEGKLIRGNMGDLGDLNKDRRVHKLDLRNSQIQQDSKGRR